MRSKIEANEYKDYILGFIFYKYVSDKQLEFARSEEFSDEDIRALSEDDTETVDHIKRNIGYFIAYDHLFSTWIEKGGDFTLLCWMPKRRNHKSRRSSKSTQKSIGRKSSRIKTALTEREK